MTVTTSFIIYNTTIIMAESNILGIITHTVYCIGFKIPQSLVQRTEIFYSISRSFDR